MKDDQRGEQYKEGPGARVAGETADRLDSALTASVARFIRRLEDIESQSPRPQANAEALAAATTDAIAEMQRVCEKFQEAAGNDSDLIRAEQMAFREKTARIFSKSVLMHHARTWPRGYPGDYEILEQIYDNAPLSKGIGCYLDRYFLSTTLAVAVRERKETLREILRKELRTREKPKVLDIACGSCREIFELALDVVKSSAFVTCLDYDADTFTFAGPRLSGAGIPAGQVKYRRYNALKMANHERNVREFGMHDVVYSVGLFDYLGNEVLVNLFKSFYALLVPGGTFIASFKDCRSYRTFDYHWLVNWNAFLQRTEDECRSLLSAAGIPPGAVSVFRERSGVIVFYVVTK